MQKKRVIMLIVLFALLAALLVCALDWAVRNGRGISPAASAEAVPAGDIGALRERYPEYFDLSGFKGLEVYVWQTAEDSFRCGVLMGTNRNKTEEEIVALGANSASADEMKLILSSYDVPDEDVFLIPCVMPLSNCFYEIDDSLRNRIGELFDNKYPVVDYYFS